MTDLEGLDASARQDRLTALRGLRAAVDAGQVPTPSQGRDVNNHIHTTWSFSPYAPAKAAWKAWEAGLSTAGIMDHDSIGGAREFLEAGRILDLPVTVGVECRADFRDTPFVGRRINNPDQSSIAYVALHGVPHDRIDAVETFFAPVCLARGRRNRAMCGRLSAMLAPAGLSLDYDRDVLPLSMAAEGGSVTERHLLYAFALQLLNHFGATPELAAYLSGPLGMTLSAKAVQAVGDPTNPFLSYDLLGLLKSDLVERFYIDATDECPSIRSVADFAEANGIVLAYAYLGDVGDSVTGDKKSQTFEDAYMDELFAALPGLGFKAVTYMPSRNTPAQLARVRSLCDRYTLFQISGEDINQPRQRFICEVMRQPGFENLYDAAWALIGHERAATADASAGMFSPQTITRFPRMAERTTHFRDLALTLYNRR